MLSSKDRILTTHAGSLSWPDKLHQLSKSIAVGEARGTTCIRVVLDPRRVRLYAAKKQRELGVLNSG